MDMHNLGTAVTIDDVATAHAADLKAQDEYDVQYLRYWVDETRGKIFCLVEAPQPRRRRRCTDSRTAWSPTRSIPAPRASDHADPGRVTPRAVARPTGAPRARSTNLSVTDRTMAAWTYRTRPSCTR